MKKNADVLIGVGIFVVVFFLYIYRITEITPGMWGDEVTLGWMADKLLRAQTYIPFLSDNYGHPTFLIYVSAFFISILGRGILSLRLVSVLFGALSAAVFYFLLRHFFNKKYSLAGVGIFLTSYPFITVARFAYEMSAAVFFFILSSIFLIKLSQKQSLLYVVLFGFTLGLGMHTYLAFRTVALILGVVAAVLFVQKRKFIYIALFFGTFICTISPLLVYEVHNPGALNARVQSLSVFSQNLPLKEVVNELQGAAWRTLTMFIMTSDPNPRQNPAGTPPFDFLTVGFFCIGSVFLCLKKRNIYFVTFFLFSSILATEIVALERIPEFHYYGLGHPNTLRISLLVPLICFLAVYGIQSLLGRFVKENTKTVWLVVIVLIIGYMNLNRYYGQKINQWIYATNFVVPLKIVDMLNAEPIQNKFLLSHSLYENQHINYFLLPNKKISQLTITQKCTLPPLVTVAVVSAFDLKNCTQEQLAALVKNNVYEVKPLMNPWNMIDAIIITSIKLSPQ